MVFVLQTSRMPLSSILLPSEHYNFDSIITLIACHTQTNMLFSEGPYMFLLCYPWNIICVCIVTSYACAFTVKDVIRWIFPFVDWDIESIKPIMQYLCFTPKLCNNVYGQWMQFYVNQLIPNTWQGSTFKSLLDLLHANNNTIVILIC